jgi:glutathione S-transferase
VNPYHKPQSLLDLNPRGLVPTLQYQNKPLYESTVLCEFLEEAFADKTPHLLPKDPYDRARTRIWTDYVGSRIIPAFHRFLQHQGQEGLKEKQQDFLNHLKEFTKEMDPEGPYFMGKDFGLIDIVIAPWANRLWVFDHFKGGSGLPEEGQGGDDEEIWKRWRKWLKAVEDRKSVKETLSEREHYLPIYQRTERRARQPRRSGLEGRYRNGTAVYNVLSHGQAVPTSNLRFDTSPSPSHSLYTRTYDPLFRLAHKPFNADIMTTP